jgi:hypothetical protein
VTATVVPSPAPTPTSTSTPTPEPTPYPDGLYDLVSQESLFAYLEDLTAIQPYSGWRNSATEGEAEALDYVAGKLGEFEYLQGLGLELERQRFRVYNSTELWETRLHLTVEGQEIEVPADGIRGNREDVAWALRFDSDGVLNDAERNPVTVDGPVVLIESIADIYQLSSEDVSDKVLLVNYAAVDRSLLSSIQEAANVADEVLALQPAGIVLVTRFSDEVGASHGTRVGDLNSFTLSLLSQEAPKVPILHARLEDMTPAAIARWKDLAQVEAARMTWDADVFSPGTSGNVVARIPGADTSQAMILGAHIDSPNNPGAMDDGSGSVVLLEVARVLNEAQVQPAVDLYLVWFGSEEIGLYGSHHFVATHQELLDRAVAMLAVDCLTRPLDDIPAELTLVTWSFGRLGDDRLTWPDYVTGLAGHQGIEMAPENNYGLYSDNAGFMAFDVPNAVLIYKSPQMERRGLAYAGHIHDSYDTVELARDVGGVLEQMARVALAAALETGVDDPALRVAPRPDRRALFVASHTEVLKIGPMEFIDFGQTLTMEGFDVDLLPYGQPVTDASLEDADLVVALPVADYPGQGGDIALYDEAWSGEEVAALERYVAEGGFLVLSTSAHILSSYSRPVGVNEDWRDVNDLAERFGIRYQYGTVFEDMAWVEKGSHSLMERLSYLDLINDNGHAFSMEEPGEGLMLAQVDGRPVIGLVSYGQAGGEVLALADVGMLGSGVGTPQNLGFWQNLARYARSR